jgi:hypothetical protein
MGTKFLKRGATWTTISDEALDMHDALPADHYIVCFNGQTGQFYLEVAAGFDLPGKLYGDTDKQAVRILRTFADRPNSTGLLLSGEKGSGKTLLAKVLANKGIETGYPTLIINSPFHGDNFNAFIQGLTQPCIILFDEFEKVFSREQQEAILTLLDGVFPSKKLFIFTCNDRYKINDHMINRPGRIYYRIEYKGLACDFITEYCNDNLKHPEHTKHVCTIAATFEEFNFDILKAIVEEMNRYGEDPFDALKMLNAQPTRQNKSKFTIELTKDGVKIENAKSNSTWTEIYEGNPLSEKDIRIIYEVKVEDSEDDDRWNDINIMFGQDNLTKFEPTIGKFTYQKDGMILILTKQAENAWEYGNFMRQWAAY